ncbi:hypothetical protein L3Q72_14120 [Vibrio sp. JC009]|uniref:hypothetical protein n=1 Tax=Vibrio sp. JC009 TaxID=2912314 RepID=UPI0023B0DB22|nr:hypothetical protein [Vibrio sp. JC009]WED21726.1 hypothetical protein L3Q72_14120 [Vibrio sp. JC009]
MKPFSAGNFVGKLVLTIELTKSFEIKTVSIDNSRPANIGQMLNDKPATQALALIPKLFLLCSQAQQAAALGAIYKALERELTAEIRKELSHRCALEWLKEHCWQTWQMQRELFGADFAIKESLALTRTLLQSVQKLPPLELDNPDLSYDFTDKWAEIGTLLEPLLGVQPADFNSMKWSEFIDWTQTDSPYARHFSVNMHNAASLGSDDSWSAEQESGSLVRQKAHPLVSQALDCWGSGLATRMLSRLVEICQVTGNPETAMIPEAGLAYASRGILEHRVKLDADGNISSYEIDAPTDRYFSQGGIVESALINQKLENSDPSWIRQLIWAIDPCVEFQVEIREINSRA